MHSHAIEQWQHQHAFLGAGHDRHERRTWIVVVLTAAMMVAEIIGGTVFGSMALVADGWHMSTHAAALAIAAFAYRFARRHVHDPHFSFGTGKVGELAGFASAVILALVALFIAYESVVRILTPVAISFDEAIGIAALGLGVNVASAWLLRDGHQHHDHDHGHHDHNLRSAYMHVVADAMTSILAIAALLAARFGGWMWMDPMVGLIGAGVIAVWSWGLIRSSGAVLLDMVPDPKLSSLVRERLEVQGDVVSDLHLWRVGPGHTALIATVVSDQPQSVAAYKARLAGLRGLSHVTVEIHRCLGHGTAAAGAMLTSS
jgi:cation diffusion facilitator family transporter